LQENDSVVCAGSTSAAIKSEIAVLLVTAFACRKVHEEGDFGEAILLCMDCFQAVDTLGAFKVSPSQETSHKFTVRMFEP
jgi:hypothetical protein